MMMMMMIIIIILYNLLKQISGKEIYGCHV